MRAPRPATLRTRFLLLAMALVLVPSLAIAWLSYLQTVRALEEKSDEVTRGMLRQAALSIDAKLDASSFVLDAICDNSSIITPLRKAFFGVMSPEEELDDYRSLSAYLYTLQNVSGAMRVRLYVRMPTLWQRERYNFYDFEDTPSGVAQALLHNDGTAYLPPEDVYFESTRAYNIITLARYLPVVQRGQQLGIACVDVSTQDILSVMQGVQVEAGAVYLTDGKRCLLSTGQDKPGLFEEALGFAGGQGEGVLREDGDFFVFSETLRNKWTLLACIPRVAVRAEVLRQRDNLVGLTLIFVFLGAVAARLFSGSLTASLRLLTNQLQRLEAGAYGETVPVRGEAEVQILQRQYNSMTTTIKRLIDEVYDMGLQRKEAELQALDAQINPHFLYNTLDNIKWMAKRENAHGVVDVVAALSRYFRLSLSGGRQEHTVAEELEHVRNYVQLLNYCYGDSIELHVDAPDHLHAAVILKMLLQPLVENAIQHGIRQKPSRRGNVDLCMRSENGMLHITVRDDGVGMTSAALGNLAEKHGGYGVYNVQRRIRLFYGERGALDYTSAPGEGTTAHIAIPIN